MSNSVCAPLNSRDNLYKLLTVSHVSTPPRNSFGSSWWISPTLAVERQTTWKCPHVEHLWQMASLAGHDRRSWSGVLPHLVQLVGWEFRVCGALLGFLFSLPPRLPSLDRPHRDIKSLPAAGVYPRRRGCCFFTSSAWQIFTIAVVRVNSASN